MNTITLQQGRMTVDVNGVTQFVVTNEVTATEGVPLALFVNRVEPDAYSHIATITDIQNYPDDRNTAINLGLDFYRRPDATKSYPLVSDALHFTAVVKNQLAYLVGAYTTVEGEFVGSDVTVFRG